MRAALLTKYREDFTVDTVPDPTISSPNDVIIRVGAAGFCRTDIHLWDGQFDGGRPPFLGVASLSFADQDAFGAAASSPEFAAAIADVPNFPDAQRLPTAFVEEVIIVGGPGSAG